MSFGECSPKIGKLALLSPSKSVKGWENDGVYQRTSNELLPLVGIYAGFGATKSCEIGVDEVIAYFSKA